MCSELKYNRTGRQTHIHGPMTQNKITLGCCKENQVAGKGFVLIEKSDEIKFGCELENHNYFLVGGD